MSARMTLAVAMSLGGAAALGGAACGSDDKTTATTTPDGGTASSEDDFGGARPVSLFHVPAGYDASKPAPLVLLLHGYGASGRLQEAYFRLLDVADTEGFFLVSPDGTLDSTQHRFWNAVDACCDFEGKGVDDVAYLTGLVAEIEKKYAIDPKRRFLVGHSNGGAMAYRLACDAADRFAAVVSLAGPFYFDPAKCRPTVPIAVLGIHGTADTTVPYDGGVLATAHPGADGTLPSAVDTAKDWAAYDKCAATPATEAAMDLDGNIKGSETRVTHFTPCAAGGDVVLWSLDGSGHVPGNLVKGFPSLIYGFLKAHPKP